MAKSSHQPPVESSSDGSSSSDEEQPTRTKSTPKPAPPKPTKNEEESESGDESGDESDDESGDESSDDEDGGKKPQPSAATPSTKSASSESDSSSDEDGGKKPKPSSSESESDDDEDGGKKPQPSSSTPSTKPAESESGEDESDSDSEAAKLVAPISSKPMAEASAKKEKASPAAEATANGEKANGKGTIIQRIWTLEDEVAILRYLVKFQSEKGPLKLNLASTHDFYDIIRKKLSIEVTNSQLFNKLKRLKKRYLGIAASVGMGRPPRIAHDKAVYELGKKIWSEEDESHVTNGVEASSRGGSLNDKVGIANDRFPFLTGVVESMGKRYAEEKLEKLDVGKADTLDKKLKKQKMAEMKDNVHEVELWKETLKLVMEGIDRATS